MKKLLFSILLTNFFVSYQANASHKPQDHSQTLDKNQDILALKAISSFYAYCGLSMYFCDRMFDKNIAREFDRVTYNKMSLPQQAAFKMNIKKSNIRITLLQFTLYGIGAGALYMNGIRN